MPAGSVRPSCRRFCLRRQGCSSRLPLFSPPSPEPHGYPLQRPGSQTSAIGALTTPAPFLLAPAVRTPTAPGGQVELERERAARRGLSARALRQEGPSPLEGGSLSPSLAGEGSKASGRGPSLPTRPAVPLPHQKDGVADHAEQHRAAQEPSHHLAHLPAQAWLPGHDCRCPLSSEAGAACGWG